ncbi:hypothetical protein H2203_007746 [Taxawa tesnikishii (nom. ined.)]|nr:hypothetical protein H2203_007746 [Dothideales sp. JES 119]
MDVAQAPPKGKLGLPPAGQPLAGTTIPLGLYLWRRIYEVGTRTIFGVPGDFNLQLLDHIYNVAGLKWIGNANELNAAYAADGYARVKGAPGCLVTTHGVGELSAMNGIAGAMTEQVKVIHVVGQTTRKMQRNRMMIHHSVGQIQSGSQRLQQGFKRVQGAAAELKDAESAPAEIDRVIRECILRSLPVYIFIPLDLVGEHVSSDLLDTPLDLSFPEDALSEGSINAAVKQIEEAIYASRNPAVLVDCLVQRHNAVEELKRLVGKLSIPIYATNMGKAIIDETHPNYVSIYNGTVCAPGVTEAFRASDLVLVVGSIPSDTNSGGFTRKITPENSIDITPTSVTVKGAKPITACPIKPLLARLAESISRNKVPEVEKPSLPDPPFESDHDSKAITQSWIWHRIAKFMQPWDVVYGETGTAAFGMPDAIYPPNVTWITQTYYGSIGYATPSALGADVALTEHAEDGTRPRGRTLLLTGDGSLQLTIQEVGTMIHYGLAPVIFLINNAGYTIERVIHGARQPYNDIVPYNFSHTLQLFGMPEDEAKANFHRVATKAEFEEVVAKESVRHPNKVQLIEVVMDALDAPWRLVNQVATRGEESIKKMKEAGFKIREHQKVLPLVNGSDGDAKPTVGMQGAVDGNPEKQQKA